MFRPGRSCIALLLACAMLFGYVPAAGASSGSVPNVPPPKDPFCAEVFLFSRTQEPGEDPVYTLLSEAEAAAAASLYYAIRLTVPSARDLKARYAGSFFLNGDTLRVCIQYDNIAGKLLDTASVILKGYAQTLWYDGAAFLPEADAQSDTDAFFHPAQRRAEGEAAITCTIAVTPDLTDLLIDGCLKPKRIMLDSGGTLCNAYTLTTDCSNFQTFFTVGDAGVVNGLYIWEVCGGGTMENTVLSMDMPDTTLYRWGLSGSTFAWPDNGPNHPAFTRVPLERNAWVNSGGGVLTLSDGIVGMVDRGVPITQDMWDLWVNWLNSSGTPGPALGDANALYVMQNVSGGYEPVKIEKTLYKWIQEGTWQWNCNSGSCESYPAFKLAQVGFNEALISSGGVLALSDGNIDPAAFACWIASSGQAPAGLTNADAACVYRKNDEGAYVSLTMAEYLAVDGEAQPWILQDFTEPFGCTPVLGPLSGLTGDPAALAAFGDDAYSVNAMAADSAANVRHMRTYRCVFAPSAPRYVPATGANWNPDGYHSHDPGAFYRLGSDAVIAGGQEQTSDWIKYDQYGAAYRQYQNACWQYRNVYFSRVVASYAPLYRVQAEGVVECDSPDHMFWNTAAHLLGLLNMTYAQAMDGAVLNDDYFLQNFGPAAALSDVRIGGDYHVARQTYPGHKPCLSCDPVDLHGYSFTAARGQNEVFIAVDSNGVITDIFVSEATNGGEWTEPVTFRTAVPNHTTLYGWTRNGPDGFALAELAPAAKVYRDATFYHNIGDSSGFAAFVQNSPQAAYVSDWFGVYVRTGGTYARVTPGSAAAIDLAAFEYARTQHADAAYPPVTTGDTVSTSSGDLYRYASPWRYYGDLYNSVTAYSGMTLHKMISADAVKDDTAEQAYRNAARYVLRTLGYTYEDMAAGRMKLTDSWFINTFCNNDFVIQGRAVWGVQTALVVSAPSDDLFCGSSMQLSVTLAPPDPDAVIQWSLTQGATLATIDSNGLLTALGSSGTVTVRATVASTGAYGEKSITLYPQHSKCCGEAGHHAGIFHGSPACVNEAGALHICAANFPDANFRAYVQTLPGAADGHFTAEEAAAITWMDCSARSIRSLAGVEFFTALTELRCSQNQLTALDVSHNPALIWLFCNSNQLTALDVSHNIDLEELDCQANRLTALDVSHNTALTELNGAINRLIALDVSKNTELIELYCDHNQLTALDVSHNVALTGLCCFGNQLTALDVSLNTVLTWLECGANQLTALDVSHNTALTELYCSGNQLTTLDVSKNTALTSLDCSWNQLTTLDVSHNPALEMLSCYNNQLTALDVSHNPVLTHLDCRDNPLTALDVSQNTELTWLQCVRNQLTELDVSHNPVLECLFSSQNQLAALDVSQNTGLIWLCMPDNQLTELDVSANTQLNFLYCENNQLTTLDVSNNTKLRQLDCGDNQLTMLDLSYNTWLRAGSCGVLSQHYDAALPAVALGGGRYVVDLLGLPGMTQEDIARIVMADGGTLDRATGIVTYYGTLPAQCAYTYDTNLGGEAGVCRMDVRVTLDQDAQPPTLAESVTVTGSEAAVRGEEVQFMAEVTPADAADKTVTWSVQTGGHLAAINQEGLLKTTAAGQVTVRATANGGSGVYGEKTLTVTPIQLESFTVTGGDFVANGGTLQLSVDNFVPADADDLRVRYALTPIDGGAEIDEFSGLLTGRAPGQVRVTATAMDGGAYAEKTVTVVDGGVSIQSRTGAGSVYAGKSLDLDAEILPNNATNTKLVWSIAEADTAFVTLKPSGFTAKVTGKAVTEAHTVTVTASAADGMARAGTFTVTVRPAVTGVAIVRDTSALEYETVTGKTLPMGLAETLQLRALVFPDGTEPQVTWKSSAPHIATVSNGLVTGLAAGTVTVTATATNGAGGNRSASCKVKITSLGRVVEIAGQAEMRAGDKQTLKAAVYADGTKTALATSQAVTWSLREQDKAYASISANGQLNTKALSEQPVWVYVTATAKEGGASAVFTVRLAPPTARVQLFSENGADVTGQILYVTLPPGGTAELDFSAAALPAAATQNMLWTLAGVSRFNPSAVIFNADAPEGSGLTPSGSEVTLKATQSCTVTLTATNADGNGARKSGFIKVVFQTLLERVHITQAENITQMAPGERVQLKETVEPDTAKLRTVRWSLAAGDEAYASVSGKGLVQAKPTVTSRKTIRVLATAKDGGGAWGYYDMEIIPRDGVLQLRHNGETVTGQTIYVDMTGKTEETVTLDAFAFLGGDTWAQSVTWKSSNRAFPISPTLSAPSATVSIRGAGVTNVTAKFGTQSVKVQIKASNLAESITVSTYTPGAPGEVAAGKTLRLMATITPATVASKSVSWALRPQDAPYASISAAGVVSAKKTVTAPTVVQATATTKDGSNLTSAPYALTILPAATTVLLYQGARNVTGQLVEIDLVHANALTFSAATLPVQAGQGVTWTVNNLRLASISTDDLSGDVTLTPTGLAGTLTLTARAADGSNKAGMVRLKLLRTATALDIRSATGFYEVAGGKTLSLRPDFGAEKPTITKVRWQLRAADAPYASISAAGVLKTKPVTAEKRVQVTAFCQDGSGLTCTREILVKPAAARVEIRQGAVPVSGTLTLRQGDTLALSAAVFPGSASQSVTWKSGSPAIASISHNLDGSVTITGGQKTGTAAIKVTAADGSNKAATVRIKVVP